MIIDKYFDEFSKKKYDQLQKRMKMDENDLKMALDEILNLNPKPGNIFTSEGSGFNAYVIPDYLIKNEDGDLIISLNGIILVAFMIWSCVGIIGTGVRLLIRLVIKNGCIIFKV